MNDKLLILAKRVQAIAESGLHYTESDPIIKKQVEKRKKELQNLFHLNYSEVNKNN